MSSNVQEEKEEEEATISTAQLKRKEPDNEERNHIEIGSLDERDSNSLPLHLKESQNCASTPLLPASSENSNPATTADQQQTPLKRQKTGPSTPIIDSRDPTEQLYEAFHLSCGSFSLCGQRTFMEDTHFIIADLESYSTPNSATSTTHNSKQPPTNYSLFGVMDGHAGDRVAKAVIQLLPIHINEMIAKLMKSSSPSSHSSSENENKSIEKALIEAFKMTDIDLLKEAKSHEVQWKDGCTANVVLMINKSEIYVSNIGDCRSVLAYVSEEKKEEVKFIALSKDHIASDPDERKRIESGGGRVTNGRVMGIMEVSRTFGDMRFKNCGVTCEPDVVRHELRLNVDKFLIIASDGLWKVMDNQTAVNFVNKFFKSPLCVKRQSTGLATTSTSMNNEISLTLVQNATKALVEEAIRLGSQDNVTAIIIAF